MTLLWLAVPLAYGADPPHPATPPTTPPPASAPATTPADQAAADQAAQIAALQKELEDLKAQLAKDEADMFQMSAEIEAGSAPPPPPPQQSSAAAFNPGITAFGDALASVAIADGKVLPGSGPWLRSGEVEMRAAVDPFATATAVFSFEEEPPIEAERAGGVSHFEAAPEECYVDLVSLPAGFSMRIGQFLQPFGVTNRAHPHDYPWTDTPIALSKILGADKFNEAGATLSWRVPVGVGLTLTAGAVRGELLDPGQTTALPQWVGRAEYFGQAGNWQVAVGASGTGLKDRHVLGGDLMVRWRQNSWHSAMLLVEALDSTGPLGSDEGSRGGYAALQLQPTRPFYLGARIDDLDGAFRYGGFATFYTSEFLRVRAGAMAGADEVDADAQLTFVWGSHPVEPYWVNR